jgi:hypothetical protein
MPRRACRRGFRIFPLVLLALSVFFPMVFSALDRHDERGHLTIVAFFSRRAAREVNMNESRLDLSLKNALSAIAGRHLALGALSA